MHKIILAILFVLSAVAISKCGEDDDEYEWHERFPEYDYKQSQSITPFNSRNDRRRHK